MIFSERDLTKPIGFLCVLCTVLGFALGFVGFVVLPWLWQLSLIHISEPTRPY